jgi:hypothetical protein
MLTETRSTPAARRPGPRRWPLRVLAAVTVGMVLYLVSAYVPPDIATSRIPVRGTLHYGLLVGHIGTAAAAALAGLLQFWPRLRARYPVAHRWTGRVYLFLGVFPSSVLAVPVAALAPFGAANQAALIMLDVLWLGTAIAGFRAARQRRFADHRRWMIRNYGLTFAAIATRFWIPVMVLAILPEPASYAGDPSGVAVSHDIASGSAWLGLVTTVLATEWILNRRADRHG